MVALKAELKFFISFWQKRKPLVCYSRHGSNSTNFGSCVQSSTLTAHQVKEKQKKAKRKRREKDA